MVSDGIDSGTFDGQSLNGALGDEADAPVRCAAPGCSQAVKLPDEKSKLEDWVSYKGEGAFWYCPEHSDQAEHPRCT